MKNPWTYFSKEFSNPDEEYQGFVYLIINHNNGRRYIGKKNFWSTRKIKQKNKTRRKTVKKESDWKSYYGSNEELIADLELTNYENIDRIILHLCKTKGEMSYLETKEQFDNKVLLNEEYYNSFIGCRIHRSHVKNVGKKFD